MFKKIDQKNIEDLSKAELTRLDIEFLKTAYGKRINRLTLMPIALTTFTGFYVFIDGLANGFINITNITFIFMIGLGLTSIARILYYQALAKFYRNYSKKK